MSTYPDRKATCLLDWNKVYNKEMSFKTFADKWMPYIDLESAAKELGECAKATADLAERNICDTTISGRTNAEHPDNKVRDK